MGAGDLGLELGPGRLLLALEPELLRRALLTVGSDRGWAQLRTSVELLRGFSTRRVYSARAARFCFSIQAWWAASSCVVEGFTMRDRR